MKETIFNTSDYAILEVLVKHNCTSPMASLTREQLVKFTDLSMSKIRMSVTNFVFANILKEGAKDGKKKTYYITKDGLKNYQNAYGLTDEELEDELYMNDDEYNEN